MMLRRRYAHLIVCFLVCPSYGFAQTEEAPDCTIPRSLARTPPGEAGSPVAVAVGLFVVDLAELDEAKEELALDFLLFVAWKDDRLAASNRGGSL